jgi:hypothetical protein
MLNRAIADITAASAGNINSFAETVKTNPTGTTCTLFLLNVTTTAHIQAMMCHDLSVAKQYYVICNLPRQIYYHYPSYYHY